MHHPFATPGPDTVFSSPEPTHPSLRDLLEETRASQRHNTRTAFPTDMGVHRTAIEAMGQLRDAIMARDVESATAALGCGAWTDLEFASFSPNEEERFTHLTLMSLAVLVDVHAHSLRMLPLLVEHGADLHQLDSSGRSLLHFAGDMHVARWLLEHGIDPALADDMDDLLHVLPDAAMTAIARFHLDNTLPEAETTHRMPTRL